MSAVVLRGDAAHLPLPGGSADLIVTSPPYWSLRDYRDGGESLKGQIGSEATWQEYLANLLACTREWVRVLKPSGSIFVNLGDKYANDAKWGGATSGKHVEGLHGKTGIGRAKVRTGIPAKSLIGLPARYALACVDDLGLIWRRDNIWHKLSALPESIEDRCATRHEYVHHFTVQGRYFAAVDEIREPHVMKPQRRPNGHKQRQQLGVLPAQTYSTSQRDTLGTDGHPLGKLPGSVREIASLPLLVPERIEHARCCDGRKRPGCEDGLDHHAAFPPDLARKAILGWSPPGICIECGEGRRPVTVGERVNGKHGPVSGAAWGASKTKTATGHRNEFQTYRALIGYACACPEPDAPTLPAVVLDPFGGTGTTSLVADVLGRTGITVDRSADYCRLARWRTTDPGERARAMQVPKPPPVPKDQASLFDDLEAS